MASGRGWTPERRAGRLSHKFQRDDANTSAMPTYKTAGTFHTRRPATTAPDPATIINRGPGRRWLRVVRATLAIPTNKNTTIKGARTRSVSTRPRPSVERTPAYAAMHTGQVKLGRRGSTAPGTVRTAPSQPRSWLLVSFRVTPPPGRALRGWGIHWWAGTLCISMPPARGHPSCHRVQLSFPRCR